MTMPKWVEEGPTGYETKDGEIINRIRKVLAVAIEALEWPTRSDYPSNVAKIALAEIE